MQFFLPILVALLLCAGCSHSKPAEKQAAVTGTKNGKKNGNTITPVNLVAGKIVSLNVRLRYVVVDFGLGRTPGPEQRLEIYRKGQKVGEIKISAQSRDNLFAADMLVGEAAVGDDVKALP